MRPYALSAVRAWSVVNASRNRSADSTHVGKSRLCRRAAAAICARVIGSTRSDRSAARGLPVVGYRVGGLPENFGDAAAGHLAPAGNDPALRAALRSLLVDPMARRRRGVAAWRRSRDFPGWDKAGKRFRNALASLHARAAEEPT